MLFRNKLISGGVGNTISLISNRINMHVDGQHIDVEFVQAQSFQEKNIVDELVSYIATTEFRNIRRIEAEEFIIKPRSFE